MIFTGFTPAPYLPIAGATLLLRISDSGVFTPCELLRFCVSVRACAVCDIMESAVRSSVLMCRIFPYQAGKSAGTFFLFLFTAFKIS